MRIEDIEEESLCSVCEYSIRRKCQIGYKIDNGEAIDWVTGEFGFWGSGAGLEYPTIGLAVLDCEGFKRYHSAGSNEKVK